MTAQPLRRRNRRLSEIEKLFIAEYLVDLNASQAAIRAGYSAKSVGKMAYLLLRRPRVANAIAEAQAKRLKAIDLSAERVLRELAAVGLSNVLDYMRLGTDGEPIIDLSRLDREKGAALSAVTVEDFLEGRGPNKRTIRRVKFRTHGKLGALDRLAKHYGVFADRVKVENAEKTKGAPQEPTHDTRQIARAVLALLHDAQTGED